MFDFFSSRMANESVNKSATLSGAERWIRLSPLVLVIVCGCDSPWNSQPRIEPDDLAIVMPLEDRRGMGERDGFSSDDVTLVAQPPQREIVPTPAGVPTKPRSAEIIPVPPAELAAGPAAQSGAPGVAVVSTAVMKSGIEPAGDLRSEDIAVPPMAGGSIIGAPEPFDQWPAPQTVLFITGNQHGYIEPCGCTGLANQKGGLARRYTLHKQLADRGWPLVPLDAGNQVRRTGRQAEVKFQAASQGLAEMDYQAIGFGPDDLALGVGELIAVAAADDPSTGRFVSSNVILIDPSLLAQTKVIDSGGRRIGTTSALDPATGQTQQSGDIEVADLNDSLAKSIAELRVKNTDFNVLLFYGSEETAADAVRKTPGFDLVVVAGGYGEPTYQPKSIDGSETQMIVTGDKGMYVGLVGLYEDSPIRYSRVPLTDEFDDAPEMRRLMAAYQNQLQSLGLEGLGLKPIAHPSGESFVGTQACAQCHTTAFEVWENSAHALATEHLVHPGERSDISRHFDPECISCHVTGWNAQNYYPYVSGYLSLEASAHLTGNGCENCHGPGAGHTAAEQKDSGVSQAKRDALRVAMRLPLENAKEKCMTCHDLDNSPDFHKEGAFEDYWSEVEHYGVD